MKRDTEALVVAVLLLLALMAFCPKAKAADYYGAVAGSGSSCTYIAPGNIDTCLGKLAAGDTLWLRGGTYPGTHILTASATVRAYNATPGYGVGEHVILDGGGTTDPNLKLMQIKCSNCQVWDLEMLWSWPGTRTSAQSGSNPTDLPFGYGFDCYNAAGLCQNAKLVNVYVHDTRGNGGSLNQAQNLEVYGAILMYQGWNAPDRAHGHNVYIQAVTGPIKLTSSALIRASENNVQGFASANGALKNFDLENNALVYGGGGDLVLGGQTVLDSLTLMNNVSVDGFINLGYCDSGAGFAGTSLISGNYLRGGMCMKPPLTGITMTGNQFYLQYLNGTSSSSWPGNSWTIGPYPTTPRPTSNHIQIQKHAYVPGRARAYVHNWQGLATVQLDMTGILAVGESYEVRDVQNFFGPLVATGTYGGGSITVPAGALPVVQPLGKPAVSPTGPDFNVFDIIRTGAAPTATPTTTPTATATPTRTATPTPASVCVTVTPPCVMVTVTPGVPATLADHRWRP